ncbi:MAG: methyltransferase domain-containing protein [Acidimicrobiia bacterium]
MSNDMLHADDRKTIVRDAYRTVGSTEGTVACKLYSPEQLAEVPRSARDFALGVGNHMVFAPIRPGDVVLDIGCGGGIDTVLAARATGPTGKVYALDFLPEMLARTRAVAAEAGVEGVVETVEGEMEAIPLPDRSVDVIVSNGVINLSPRKSRVFAECGRVLRPGGRFCVSDITIVEDQLPTEVLVHPSAWAG